MKPTKDRFISPLHSFRGIAILAIVGAHCWSGFVFVAGGVSNAPHLLGLYSLTESLFHGSTLFFALISGLLYSLVLKPKGMAIFFRSKLFNVAAPYVFISLIYTLVFWGRHVEQAQLSNVDVSFTMVLLNNILFGTAYFHLWYIPVLVVLFLFTPLLSFCLQQKVGKYVVLLIALAPLVISRTEYPQLLSWQSFLFFLGAYAAGILAGANYDLTKQWIAKHLLLICGVFLLSFAVVFHQFFNGAEPIGIFAIKQTAVYIQKLSAAAILLHWLTKKEHAPSKILMTLGNHAFAIYFLHAFFASNIRSVLIYIGFDTNVFMITAGGAITYIGSVVISLLISFLIQKIVGKYSRQIIGS